LEALDIKWDKIELEARAGQTITLVIENKGVLDHDFVIEELGIEVKLSPGETQEVTFVVDEIGTYTYICAVPGHLDAGMIGQLTISE
jgi:nitrite reductase (NO-forming)